ncbi:LacI family transcriptional regulator [Jiangella ureilytica]|uniref:LacI family transcriptional regulator n=2 Tax=Jiangella ureilytica TaxID=2530374 RepID=A0A4R4RH79_9ACTN|nr:LacI family transcriptional regulator [Jiangella ureilytica]
MVATMRDVAERAGVSLKTVSNVINDYPHITPATRAKVEAAITALDYRPNITARALRSGRVGVVALAVPDLRSPFFAALAAAVGRAAKRHDHAVLIEQTDGDAGSERVALDGLRNRLVDGVLVWQTAATTRSAGSSRPVVLLGAGRPDATAPPVEILARDGVDLLLARLR